VSSYDVFLAPSGRPWGTGAGRCRAGERTQFTVEARDSRGNRLVAGGASLTLQVAAPGQEPMRGSVLDQGDGTYTASYAVDQAGPYLLVSPPITLFAPLYHCTLTVPAATACFHSVSS